MSDTLSRSDNDNGQFEAFEIQLEGEAVWIHWPERNASLLLGPADYVFGKFAEKMADVAFGAT